MACSSFDKLNILGTNDPFDFFPLENPGWELILLSKIGEGPLPHPPVSHHKIPSWGLFWVGPSSATVVATLYFSDCLSGRRQEILVTLTAAAPFPLSSSNDVGWLWWQEVRNWAIVEVRKTGHCLCRCWARDPAEGCWLSSFLYCFSFRSSFYGCTTKASCFQNMRLFCHWGTFALRHFAEV